MTDEVERIGIRDQGGKDIMIEESKLRQPEIRELMTASILDWLDHLPEPQRSIFICKHYRGLPEEKIADDMKCSRAEVINALTQVNLTLVQRAGTLLA